MVLPDIHGACDVFSRCTTQSDGVDGYVSRRGRRPSLAHDGPGTEAAARDLHERINRRNLMVKIPGTAEGLAPIRADDRRGPQHQRHPDLLARALRRRDRGLHPGLETFARRTAAADLSKVASVASFFISRVDTEVDRRLEAIGTDEALALRGKAAVAQGKLAYRLFPERVRGQRWDALAARGARVQRPLWASTRPRTPTTPTCSTSTS